MGEDTGIELVNSIATDKLSSVGRDLGEVALDTVLKEGILRDITVFDTIAALYQAGVEIHHQFFVRKVITKGWRLPKDKNDKSLQMLDSKLEVLSIG